MAIQNFIYQNKILEMNWFSKKKCYWIDAVNLMDYPKSPMVSHNANPDHEWLLPCFPVWLCIWNRKFGCFLVCPNIWSLWIKNWTQNLVQLWSLLTRHLWAMFWISNLHWGSKSVHWTFLLIEVIKNENEKQQMGLVHRSETSRPKNEKRAGRNF